MMISNFELMELMAKKGFNIEFSRILLSNRKVAFYVSVTNSETDKSVSASAENYEVAFRVAYNKFFSELLS